MPEKALSIKNPWAYLIAMGIKDVENRSWKTHFRGRIYIHASLKPDRMMHDADGYSKEQWNILMSKEIDTLFLYTKNPIKSAIIGEVDIVGCVKNHSSIWAHKNPDMWHWILESPVMYQVPIFDVKGAQSFWKYPRKEK